MMLRNALIAAVLTVSLAACSTFNSGTSNMQFNGQVSPFPKDYREQAAAAAVGQPLGAPLAVSYPAQTVGDTALSPRRWYVCLRGSTRNELILVFDRFDTPEPPLLATASPMCAGKRFSALSVKPSDAALDQVAAPARPVPGV